MANNCRKKEDQGMKTLKASDNPMRDIALVAYKNQPPEKRMYMPRYESYFNMLPVLNPGEQDTERKMAVTHEVVQALADKLAGEKWVTEHDVPEGGFHRHILAMEKPQMGSMFGDIPDENSNSEYVVKPGKELIIAHWGDKFASPVHGHMAGLEIEEMISGRLIVNRYELVPGTDTVHMTSSTMYEGRQTIEFAYTEAGKDDKFERQQLIHNFISVGASHSLHYVPEHSLDGMGNGFKVIYFEDVHDLNEENTKRITLEQALQLQPGAVLLVRSKNVDYFGDHFVAITGGMIVKPHGIRQKDVAVVTKGQHHHLLDGHTEFDSNQHAELVLLQLNEEMAREFIAWHHIEMDKTESFDDHYDLRYDQVKELSTHEAMYAKRTDVMLIRSRALPELGDHYVLVTGAAVQKDRGLRPQTAIFPAMQNSPLLDMFDGVGKNVIILKLDNEATQEFLNFYGIHLNEALEVVSDNTKLEMA